MKKFGLLVGNGFTLDYSLPHNLHSSFPLRHFKNLGVKYSTDFLEHLPEVKKSLLGSNLSDYEAIITYVSKFKHEEEDFFYNLHNKNHELVLDPKYGVASNSHIQLRRFIAMAYSAFQLELDRFNDLPNWKWVDWFKKNKDTLSFCISLNYDLVLENALRTSGIPSYRVGTNEHFCRVPIIKPHGSIDFDIPTGFIQLDNVWNFHGTLNDFQLVEIVPKVKWLSPRLEADIICPSLHNIQSRLSWVRKMFDQYSYISQDLDALVIIGCSYWEVDRYEIDIFLKQLKRRTKVYVIDPDPSKELKKKIQALGLSYREANISGLPW